MTSRTFAKSLVSAIAIIVTGTFVAAPAALAKSPKGGYKYVSDCPDYIQDPFHECHNEEHEVKAKYPPTFPPPAGAAPFDPFHTEGGGNGGEGGGGGGGNGRG